MPTTTRITGLAALSAYEADPSVVLCSHTDPTAEGREGITLDDARAIAREDASLVYADVPAEAVPFALHVIPCSRPACAAGGHVQCGHGPDVPATRRTATVRLTAYNMGPNATKEEFDAWVRYVAANIDDETGLDVTVDAFRFAGRGAGGDVDEISGWETEEDRETIVVALETLWERGCMSSFEVAP